MVAFRTESWLWFGLVMVMVSLRFVSRILHFKTITRLQIEDYLMLFLTCMYTVFIVLINIVVHANTNLINPDDPPPTLSPADIATRTYGAKVNVVVEQGLCTIQWGTKICLLILYYRLTQNLVQNVLVKVVGTYVITTFVVMETLYFGVWCQPFHDYWQTPTDKVQCTTALHHLIVNISFNLSSDLLIMSIPLPLLLRAHLDLKRKILLVVPFSFGFFSMVSAILSKNLSFNHPFSPEWVFWYTREASCVMMVANMPYAWGLARRAFNLRSFFSKDSVLVDSDIEDGIEPTSPNMAQMGVEIKQPSAASGDAFNKNLDGVGEMKDEKQLPIWVCSVEGEHSTHARPEPTTKETIVNGGNLDPAMGISRGWGKIDWDKGGTTVEVVQLPSTPRTPSATHLMPPTPVAQSPSLRRTSTVESRGTSSNDARRTSTFSSRRSTRASLSESRRNTRTSINIDAIDRLYRLDDEDLIADMQRSRPHSRASDI